MCRYIYITELLCCIIEFNIAINQLYINKVIFKLLDLQTLHLPGLSLSPVLSCPSKLSFVYLCKPSC